MFRAISSNRHFRYVDKVDLITLVRLTFRHVARDLNGNLGNLLCRAIVGPVRPTRNEVQFGQLDRGVQGNATFRVRRVCLR